MTLIFMNLGGLLEYIQIGHVVAEDAERAKV